MSCRSRAFTRVVDPNPATTLICSRSATREDPELPQELRSLGCTNECRSFPAMEYLVG